MACSEFLGSAALGFAQGQRNALNDLARQQQGGLAQLARLGGLMTTSDGTSSNTT